MYIMSSSFKEDLKFGNEYEKLALEYIDYDEYEFCNQKEYDIKIKKDNTYIYYEVKADRLAYKTSNVVIEYQCYGNPSGICTSKANYWVIFVINDNLQDCYIIPKKRLNKMVQTCKTVNGGDYGLSRMYLLELKRIKKYLKNKKNS